MNSRAEIEFLVTDEAGGVIPIEVKSGKRTRAKSLASYVQKCHPRMTIKLTATEGSPLAETVSMVLPLYYAEMIPEAISA